MKAFVIVLISILFLIQGCGRIRKRVINPITEQELQQLKQELLTQHNRQRLRYNKSNFTISKVLEEAAQDHANWMARKQNLSHSGKRGSSLSDRIHGNYYTIGENIAMNMAYDANEVVEMWMNSTGHRRNLLDENFHEIGFGIAISPDQTEIYWCVDFAGN